MKKYLVVSSPIISFYLKMLGSKKMIVSNRCKVTLGYIVSVSFGLIFSIFIISVAFFSYIFLKAIGLGDIILISILAIISYYVYSRELVENSENIFNIVEGIERIKEAIFEVNGIRIFFSSNRILFISRNPNIEKISINYILLDKKPLIKFIFKKTDIDKIYDLFNERNIFAELRDCGVEEIILFEKNGSIIKINAFKPDLDILVKNVIKLGLKINSRDFIQRILKISIKNIGIVNIDNIYAELLKIHLKIFLKSAKTILENRIEKIMATEKINRTSAIIKLWNVLASLNHEGRIWIRKSE